MGTHRRRGTKAESEWLSAADALFMEFPNVPLEDVVRAMNTARREPLTPSEHPHPHLVMARARELLSEAGHQAAVLV